MSDSNAPKFRIYPSIGVARVGNGPADKKQVVWSPEIPCKDMYATDLDLYTKAGKLKKMAQRFYVYECDDEGNPLRPINPDDYQIEWKVEVANKKPFWYDFNNCLDLSIVSRNQTLSPNVANNKLAPGKSTMYRNPNVIDMSKRVSEGEDDYNYRKELVTRASGKCDREVEGRLVELTGFFPSVHGSDGISRLAQSMGCDVKTVTLGTIEYDDGKYGDGAEEKEARYRGTLIFYAGDGVSAALNPSDLNIDFADNSNWYDDICDGRVTATLTPLDKDGTTKAGVSPVTLDDARSAAWIVTAPPNYAPQIDPLSTMFDLVTGTANEDFNPGLSLVIPLMYRLYRMQWVNLGDFLAPSFRESIDQLAARGELKFLYTKEPKEEADRVRKKIFNLFRNPAYHYNNEPVIPSKEQTDIQNRGVGTDELKMPFYPSDGVDYPGSPAQWFAIPPVLYQQLEYWRDGKFESIPGLHGEAMDELGAFFQQCYIEAADEPNKEALLMTRAVLDTLYGGGFHPGVELTWPIRHEELYAENKLVFPAVLERDGHSIGLYGLREVRVNAASREREEEIFYKDFGYRMDSENIRASLATEDGHWLWQLTPGDMTKWMGIPWQSDAGSCQAVFTEEQYPVPAWWAANLPVYVLTEDSYTALNDPEILDETKRYIFANRLQWLHTANTGYVGYHAEGGYTKGLVNMVYQWDKIGAVVGRKLEADVPGIPKLLYVAYASADADKLNS